MHHSKHTHSKFARSDTFAGVVLMAAAGLQGCGTAAHSAAAGVAPAVATNLVVSKGGTYSGTWSSNDPDAPAINIATDEG